MVVASDTKVVAVSAVLTTAPTTTAEDLQAADSVAVPEDRADPVVTVLREVDPVDLVGMAALPVVGLAAAEAGSVGTSSAKVVLVGSMTATPSVRVTSAPFFFFFSCCRARPPRPLLSQCSWGVWFVHVLRLCSAFAPPLA